MLNSSFASGRIKSQFFYLSLFCTLLFSGQLLAEVLMLKDGSKWASSLSKNVPFSSISGQLTPDGKQQLWFTLDRKDGAENNFRTELTGRIPEVTRQLIYGQQYSVDFTLLLPNEWQSDNTHDVVFQIHNVPDEDEKGAESSPIFAIRVKGDSIYSSYCYSSAKQSWRKNNQACIESGQLAYAQAGGKYRIHIDFKLSQGVKGSGIIRIAIDDVPKFSYDGPFGFDDDQGPYMKFGIYKAAWKPKHNNRKTITDLRRYGFEDMRIIKVVQSIPSTEAPKINEGSSSSGLRNMGAQENRIESQKINMEAQMNQLKEILARLQKQSNR